MKYLISILIGLISGIVTLFLMMYFALLLFPLPKFIDIQNKESLAQNMDQIPQINFIIILLGFALGSLVAGFVSVKVKTLNSRIPVIIIGLLFTFAVFVNSIYVPQPIWMVIGSSMIFIPMVYLGGRLGIGSKKRISNFY
jgi:hypothetical protein